MKWRTLVILAAGMTLSQWAGAQTSSNSANRAGAGETRLTVSYLNSADVSFNGGTQAEIADDTGFSIGGGYHLTDNFEVGGSVAFNSADYRARIVGDQAGEIFDARGDLEYTTLMVDATYNLLKGPFTPFVTGAIGWNWTDTNLATEPPQIGCWWDPWWGYVCADFQDTRTIDGFAYAAAVGARIDFNRSFALKGSYRITWVDFDNATGTPDFDGYELTFSWKF